VSCSLHDSFELESKGIPTVTLCTTGFLNAGAKQASMLGIPNLPIIGIPFPFASLPPDKARARGAEAFDDVVTALVRSVV
jgi:hypothetical protein